SRSGPSGSQVTVQWAPVIPASFTPPIPIPIANSTQVVGITAPALTFDTRTCDDVAPAGNPSYVATIPQNPGVGTSSAAGAVNFNVRFTEGFPYSFNHRLDSNQDPSTP